MAPLLLAVRRCYSLPRPVRALCCAHMSADIIHHAPNLDRAAGIRDIGSVRHAHAVAFRGSACSLEISGAGGYG